VTPEDRTAYLCHFCSSELKILTIRRPGKPPRRFDACVAPWCGRTMIPLVDLRVHRVANR
jgi:hypothetical protein